MPSLVVPRHPKGAVNNVRNDNELCIEAIGEPPLTA
jgi:hypothetical protein